MSIAVHNLLTHHSADLRKMADVLKKTGHDHAANMDMEFDRLLRVAQVFKLPDNGRITGLSNPFGEFQKLIMENAALARLPYPVTCLEWDSFGDVPTGKDYLARALMAIAIDGDLFRERMGAFARPPFEGRAKVFDKARIFVMASHALPNMQLPALDLLGFRPRTMPVTMWHAIGLGADDCRLAEEWQKEKGAVVSHGYMCWASALNVGPVEKMLQSLEIAAKDNNQECFAVMDFLLASSCSNVTASTLPSSFSRRSNERRVVDGKPKFYDYHVLKLTGASENNDSQGGSHASPRMHLRRGHIRRLPESRRRIWVNACVVGKPENGVVVKDYDATPLKKEIAI